MKIYKYGDNIDTDVIIPARHLNDPDPKALSSHCMEDIDANFAKTVEAGDIVVGGANFGCGSSREQAPIALRQAQIALVIAKGFARIFRRNSINIGLPVWAADVADGLKTGDRIEVDLEKGTVTVNGEVRQFQPMAENVVKTLTYGGLIPRVRAELGITD